MTFLAYRYNPPSGGSCVKSLSLKHRNILNLLRRYFLLISLILAQSFTLYPFTDGEVRYNTIEGRVYNARTGESLPGVNIIVNELEAVGAATDANGYFSIRVPAGSYSVTASYIGFQSVVRTDVIVTTRGSAWLTIRMAESYIGLEEVEITPDYFDRAVTAGQPSTITLSQQEIRQSPGSGQDFQRILQAMPGVGFSTDQTNELIVRGGAPNENLIMFDDMEIHSLNHYPNEFNSAGPISMVNVELIDDIKFSAGGFGAQYGDKLSSVMAVRTRDGTRSRSLKGNVNVSMAGAGAIFEGRINEGRGSWIASARRSYIDLVAAGVGLTAVPEYYDGQFKVVYDLTRTHTLRWSGIYGNGIIFFEGSHAYGDESQGPKFPELAGTTDSLSVEEVDVRQHQYATGVTLRSVWSPSFYSIVNLSTNAYHYDFDNAYNYLERVYDDEGRIINERVLSTQPFYRERTDDREYALRTEFVWNAGRNHAIEFGGAVKFTNYKTAFFLNADTVLYDLTGDGIFETGPVIRDEANVNYDLGLFNHHKSYFYINDRIRLFDARLTLNVGLRYDYFSFSRRETVSPRLSASYFLKPDITSINLAYGDYYQTHNIATYIARDGSDINRYLKNTRARHYVAGIEHLFNKGLKVSLEGYYKEYSDIPVSEQYIYSIEDRTFRSDRYLNIGERNVYGLDLFIHQKLVGSFYGTLSISRMWSETKDPRIGSVEVTIPSGFEYPAMITLIAGNRFRDLRTFLNSLPAYIRYPSYLLPFSDDMEIGVRWTYSSGSPYTPRVFETNTSRRIGGMAWTDGVWQEEDKLNSARYPAYHRLDIMFNSRFNFSNWNIVLFLSVQNVYNRQNIAAYRYYSNGTYEPIYQFSLLPVMGLEVEF